VSVERRKTHEGIIYRVKIYNRGRAFKSASFTRKIDAEKWEAEQKTQLGKQKYFPTDIQNITLTELFNLWLIKHALIKKEHSSIVRDKQCYRDYIQPSLGSMNLADIVPVDINCMINKLFSMKRLSNKSVNNVLSTLRTLLNYSVKKHYLQSTPMNAVEFLPVKQPTLEYWSRDEVCQFLLYASNKYNTDRSMYLLYLMALTTGIRQGELIGLKWDCVCFNSRLITVRRTYDVTQKLIKETTKSKKVRYIGISDDLLVELIQHRNNNPVSFLVFDNGTGECIGVDKLQGTFARDVKKARLRRIRFHDLRHTFASHYMMSGGNIFDLQQILGHSDTRTTMVYAHLAPSHIAHTTNIINYRGDINDAKRTLKIVL